MGRYRSYGNQDDPGENIGDKGFIGVNNLQTPDILQPGLVSDALNKLFEQGVGATRPGCQTVKWAERGSINFPVDFPVNFDSRVGFRKVYGAGVFSDPVKNEGGQIACNTGSYRIAANQVPAFIPYPVNVLVTESIEILQAFDRVLMLRGEEQETLVWNPNQDFETQYGFWETVTQSDSRNSDPDNSYGDGLRVIPNSTGGCVAANRVLLISGRDEIIVSDILDYTRYNDATQRFRINSGSDDQLMRLFTWNKTTIIAFKDQSIHLLTKFSGDLSELNQDLLTPHRGLFASKAVFSLGKDIGFLSEGHIYTISQVFENEIQAMGDPLSGPIEKYMKRINWNYASRAVAETHDDRSYIAVPLDGSKYNNAILVYDWINKQWAGYWKADFMDIISFIKLDRAGRKKLFAVNGFDIETSAAKGAVYMIESGYADYLYGDEQQIVDSMTTRGYTAGSLTDKTYESSISDISTWYPIFSIASVSDGVNEEISIRSNETKDRTKYYNWGKIDFDITNGNDDFEDPYREDYSVDLDQLGIYAGTLGFNPQLHQRIQLPAIIDIKGRYMQLKYDSTQGRMNIHAAGVEVSSGESDNEEKV